MLTAGLNHKYLLGVLVGRVLVCYLFFSESFLLTYDYRLSERPAEPLRVSLPLAICGYLATTTPEASCSCLQNNSVE